MATTNPNESLIVVERALQIHQVVMAKCYPRSNAGTKGLVFRLIVWNFIKYQSCWPVFGMIQVTLTRLAGEVVWSAFRFPNVEKVPCGSKWFICCGKNESLVLTELQCRILEIAFYMSDSRFCGNLFLAELFGFLTVNDWIVCEVWQREAAYVCCIWKISSAVYSATLPSKNLQVWTFSFLGKFTQTCGGREDTWDTLGCKISSDGLPWWREKKNDWLQLATSDFPTGRELFQCWRNLDAIWHRDGKASISVIMSGSLVNVEGDLFPICTQSHKSSRNVHKNYLLHWKANSCLH